MNREMRDGLLLKNYEVNIRLCRNRLEVILQRQTFCKKLIVVLCVMLKTILGANYFSGIPIKNLMLFVRPLFYFISL